MKKLSKITVQPNSVDISGWTFNELSLAEMEMYSSYLRKTQYPTNVFSWNFAFLWTESRARRITWKIVDEMLVIFRHLKNEEIDLLSLPLGEGTPEKVVKVLQKCMSFCHDWNSEKGSFSMVTINSPQLEFLLRRSEFNRLFKVKKLKNIERIIDINNLLNFHGKEFSNLRRKVNQFYRNYPDAVIREYTAGDLNNLIQLQKSWGETSGTK